MRKINLKSELILNKKFKTELSGYNAKEVDEYLDKILLDYKFYESEIDILKRQLIEKNEFISDKQEELEELKLEIDVLKKQLLKAEESSNLSIKKDIEEIKKKINEI
ncbi:MAG: DivIVA domain-containing protein [Mycoplasma sp.]|nr:DivIVA domain-containing protein [Mycoplasma sp.]